MLIYNSLYCYSVGVRRPSIIWFIINVICFVTINYRFHIFVNHDSCFETLFQDKMDMLCQHVHNY